MSTLHVYGATRGGYCALPHAPREPYYRIEDAEYVGAIVGRVSPTTRQPTL